MDTLDYYNNAKAFWNAEIEEKGIQPFAVRPDVGEFIQHGKDEAAIFLEPYKARTIKPRGNGNAWPGDFVNCKSVEELCDVVTKCDIVIATRMHAGIVAKSYNIPIIGINWDKKISGFYQMIGLKDWYVDYSTCSAEW